MDYNKFCKFVPIYIFLLRNFLDRKFHASNSLNTKSKVIILGDIYEFKDKICSNSTKVFSGLQM